MNKKMQKNSSGSAGECAETGARALVSKGKACKSTVLSRFTNAAPKAVLTDKEILRKARHLVRRSSGCQIFKTHLVRVLHDKFGITLRKAQDLFVQFVEEGLIVAADKRYTVSAPPLPNLFEGTVRGHSRKYYELIFDPFDTRYESGTVHEIFMPELLRGDVITCRRAAAGSWDFVELVRRGSDRVLCRVSSKYLAPNGESATVEAEPVGADHTHVTIRVDDVPHEQLETLEGRVFEVCLDTESMTEHTNKPTLRGSIGRILGREDDADTEIEIAVKSFGIPTQFRAETLRQAEALPDNPAEEDLRDRVDLRDLEFVTIDGEDARDFDDAVWCAPSGDGWRLLVAIADVSYYVQPASPLDYDAQQRCTSVYFPRRVVPMLPEKLSNGLCSLNPDVDRCTLVCDMVFDGEGSLVGYQFYPAMIHSKARLTYKAVWQALNGDDAELIERGGSLERIAPLYALYKALRAARTVRGAIDFETRETQFVFEPETQRIAGIVQREHNDAHRLIEECMLAANVCAADLLCRAASKTPSLYRVHDKPLPEKLQKLRTVLKGLGVKIGGGESPKAADFEAVVQAVSGQPYADVVQTALLRSMQQAQYSPHNNGHYGLAYPRYTHFTSPIRRYPDLLVHRSIRALLKGEVYKPECLSAGDDLLATRIGRNARQTMEQKLPNCCRPSEDASMMVWERLGVLCSAAERRADEASRDVIAWLKCTYVEAFLDKVFTAEVTGAVSAGLYVRLKNLFVEGFVHVSNLGNEYFEYDENRQSFSGTRSGCVYKIGDQLRVQLTKVDRDSRSIDFTVVQARPTEYDSGRFKQRRNSKHRRR